MPRFRLGRVVEKDLRDLDYLLEVPQAGGLPTRAVRLELQTVWDQGQTAMSVAESLLAALGLTIPPDRVHADGLGPIDPNEPISLRDGCKALKRLGLISGYRWTYEVADLTSFLLATGRPVVAATDFYDWMVHPHPESGLLARLHGQAARLIGGGAFVVCGVDLDRHLAEIQPAYGTDWGGWIEDGARQHAGQARIGLDDLSRLFKGNGEAVVLERA